MSWEYVKLNKIGSTYTGLSNKKADDFGSGKPYITYLNVFNNSKIDPSLFEKVQVGFGENQNKAKYGDVFFTTSSETPDEVGMCSVLLNNVDELYLNSFCFGFRPFNLDTIIPEYARYCFRSEEFRKQIGNLAQGSTRYNLSKGYFLESSVLITTDPKEQKKIAEILESVDNSIESTKKAIEKYKLVKQGMMQDLLTRGIDQNGKLRPTYEETPELYKPSKLGFIPKEWDEKTFADISTVNQGLQISIKDRFTTKISDDVYQYITIDFLNRGNTMYYVAPPSPNVICSENDILMTRTGNTGTVITGVKGVFHNNFFIIKYDDKLINKDFLFHYLNRAEMKKIFINYSGITTIPDLNHKDYFQTKLKLPKKLSEQQQIADCLTSIDNKIEAEQTYLKKLQKIKQGLLQDLLTGKVRCKF